MIPKELKFNKYHRRHNDLTNNRSIRKCLGNIGIKALTNFYITENQIESIRRTLKKFLPKNNQIWINVFPDLPITKKPKEVRMGKGVGGLDHWSVFVKKGTIIFEYNVLTLEEGFIIFKKIKSKFSGKVKFIYF